MIRFWKHNVSFLNAEHTHKYYVFMNTYICNNIYKQRLEEYIINLLPLEEEENGSEED